MTEKQPYDEASSVAKEALAMAQKAMSRIEVVDAVKTEQLSQIRDAVAALAESVRALTKHTDDNYKSICTRIEDGDRRLYVKLDEHNREAAKNMQAMGNSVQEMGKTINARVLWIVGGALSALIALNFFLGERAFPILSLPISSAAAQDIEAGPIRVDSGDHWTDLGTVVFLVLFCAVVYVVVKRLTR